jgi:hypothetical protein
MSFARHLPTGQRLFIAIIAIGYTFISVSLLLEPAADGRLRALFDQPWPRATCGIASMVAILCAAPAMLVAIYYLLSTVAEVRPEKRMLVQFIAPIAFFLPQMWTEAGNRHRRLLFRWLAIFGLLGAIPLACKSFVV